MYKAFTAEEFRKHFLLPVDYVVDGLLSYGAWDEEKHRNKIKKILDEFKLSHSSQIMKGFLSRVLELKIDGKNYWFVVMYGGAQLSEYIHLACLFGSKKNIHIGSCGGLHPEMNSLDLIIPTWSYGNESTTRVYDREAFDFKHYSDNDLSKKIEENLPHKYVIRKGPLITVQAMMGETWDDVKSWSENGYFGVEMETATVFSVSKNFKVPGAALLYVSDNLIKGQTVGDDSHIQQKEMREAVKNDVYKTGLITLIG
jgi:purine-nucleoside phosphorylase